MAVKEHASLKEEQAAQSLKAAQDLAASREESFEKQLAEAKTEAAEKIFELEEACRSRESKMADLAEENAALAEQVGIFFSRFFGWKLYQQLLC